MEDPTEGGSHVIPLTSRVAVEVFELIGLDEALVLLVVDGVRFAELQPAGEA